MDDLLRKLLERLEAIAEDHEELYDSDVRQLMSNAIVDGFVRARNEHVIPDDFGMHSAQANAGVRSALDEFVFAANEKASELGIASFHGRLAVVQNGGVRTQQGNDYEDFFGHSRPELFDEFGNVFRTE